MWKRSVVGAGLRSLDSRQPGPAFTKLIHYLSRCNATLVSCLRLDCIDFGATKQDLNASSPEQVCKCEKEETREHFLLGCEGMWERARSWERGGAVGVDSAVGASPSVYVPPPLFYPHKRMLGMRGGRGRRRAGVGRGGGSGWKWWEREGKSQQLRQG
jgi:hypothetical protein